MFRLFCLLFLFKQKTAYEMRISDWSSDVCSSDLHRDRVGHHHFADLLFARTRRRGHMRTLFLLAGALERREAARTRALILVQRTRDEIGRASCRERVCQ